MYNLACGGPGLVNKIASLGGNAGPTPVVTTTTTTTTTKPVWNPFGGGGTTTKPPSGGWPFKKH